MKDQHKNKLLEILKEECTQGREIVYNHKTQKIQGKTPMLGQLKREEQRRTREGDLVVVPLGEVEYQLGVYAWRACTNQPLLAAICTGIQLRRGETYFPPSAFPTRPIRPPFTHDDATTLRIETEPSMPLSALMPLSLSQHLYCLKEAAYGFEQLHCCFGHFDIQMQAVRVAADGRVKVWHGVPLSQNPRQSEEKDEERVVKQLVKLFQGRKMDTSGFRQFYQGITILTTFLQLLKYIDSFIEKHKIKIDKRIITRGREVFPRPQSPKHQVKRVPKFLSPSAVQPLPSANIRLSLGINVPLRRQPLPAPPSPSPSPEKPESISLKKTTQTRSPRRVNLVRTGKCRRGSDNNFCFTSLHRLEATRQNLLGQAKISEICFEGQADTMASLDAGNSLLRNVEQLFEEEDGENCLSVSVQMKDGKMESKGKGWSKGLANYGRKVNESFINTHPRQ